jgi:hypothetical protein
MGYLSHKRPRLYSVCRNHNLTLTILMNYQWVCNKSNTTGTTGEIGTVYPYGMHEVIPDLLVSTQCFHIIVCPFVFFLLVIVL